MCLCAITYQGERDDKLRALEQYCDLVALHRIDPDVGWPDYNKVFDAQCTQDGKVQPKFYE